MNICLDDKNVEGNLGAYRLDNYCRLKLMDSLIKWSFFKINDALKVEVGVTICLCIGAY